MRWVTYHVWLTIVFHRLFNFVFSLTTPYMIKSM